MIGLIFGRFSKNQKIGKLQIFEAILLTFSRVSDSNVLVHDVEHGKMNKSPLSDFLFEKLS